MLATLLLAALMAADVATTGLGLTLGLQEANPFVAGLLESGGIPAFVAAKAAAMALILLLAPRLRQLSSQFHGWVLAALNATMTAIVAWNTALILHYLP